MKERTFEKSVIDWNLSVALSSWQAGPDSPEHMRKMDESLNSCGGDCPVSVKIKKELLRSINAEDGFISSTVAEAYGKIDGNLIVFEFANGIKARTGETKGRGYLFLEKNGQRIGYCRPDCIASISLS